jgi:uncharacterized protein YfiM (DUF2279 family)
MKKILIILMILISVLTAQEVKKDSAVTRIKISDVQYFDVQSAIDENNIDHETSEKPFALRQVNDKWFSKDKWMHLSASYFTTIQSAYALENMLLVKPENSRYISVGITLSFSLGKEFYDVFAKKSIFSWKDLTYDILGAGLGYLTVMAIEK